MLLEISKNSQENYYARVSFLITTLLKKILWHRCFPVNFVKFLIKSFFIEHLWWLLLSILAPNFFTKQNAKLTRTDFCDLFVIAKKVFAILDKFVSVAASK